MRVLWIMEQFLAMEAEAKYLLTARDRSYERSLKQELLRILDDAEIWYGPRISSYEVHEPLITECFTAHVMIHPLRFARIYLPHNLKPGVLTSYTLAHEAIHVLGPAFNVPATVLEEGLATYFSIRYMNSHYGLRWQNSGDPTYDAAMQAISTLLAKNPFVIKELRAHQPVISKIDEKLLVEVAGIDRDLAKFLCADFQRYAQTPSPWGKRVVQDTQLFVDGFRSIWNQWRSQ